MHSSIYDFFVSQQKFCPLLLTQTMLTAKKLRHKRKTTGLNCMKNKHCNARGHATSQVFSNNVEKAGQKCDVMITHPGNADNKDFPQYTSCHVVQQLYTMQQAYC